MKKKLLLFFVFCACWAITNAQSIIKPSDLVNAYQQKYTAQQIEPLQKSSTRTAELPKELENYELLDININSIIDIKDKNAPLIELNIPYHDKIISVEMVKVDIMRGATHVVTQPSNLEVQMDLGSHYQGIIKGNDKSLVAISIFDHHIEGFISGDGKNYILGILDDRTSHIIYESKDIDYLNELECGTDDNIGLEYTAEQLKGSNNVTRDLAECVELYIEVDNDIYQGKGGLQPTTNYITGLMNQVIALYANENINCSLLPLNIWTGNSPYNGTSTSTLLNQFQNYNNNWSGTLAQLLSYQASGGLAAGFDGICNSYRDYSMCYSSIGSQYANVPNYSWSVMVVTHEFGHLFGSRHTHACVWNGNNTAIDACSGNTEGSCYSPPNPSEGGTIMSYCHLTSVGIDLSLGFGPQPGNVIRYEVDNGSCTASCDGGEEDPCTDTEVTVTINTDNYGSETSWDIKNSNGTTVASGSGYANNSTYNTTVCLADGCYTFNIYDSYGDGLCCSYGSGSYSVFSADGTIASGASFGSSESTDFCVGGNSGDVQAPTTPTQLSASGTTINSTVLSWNASTDNVGVTGYEVYSNGSFIGTVTSNGATVTSLTPSTQYTFYVRAYDDAGNYSANSNSVTITTLSDTPPVTYCDLSGNNAYYEWIDLVQLNNLSHSSGNDGGYADNTNLVANLPYGSNTIYLSAGFRSTSYLEYWSVWIDYNQDGTFSSSERIASGSSSSSALLSATFNVPSNALSGNTRLRVAMKYNDSSSSSCGTFTYGEVEDYSVNVGASALIANNIYIASTDLSDEVAVDTRIYPNPVANGYFFIETNGLEIGEYEIMNTLGQRMNSNTLTDRAQQIDVSNLKTGMYLIRLSDGQKTFTHKVMINN